LKSGTLREWNLENPPAGAESEIDSRLPDPNRRQAATAMARETLVDTALETAMDFVIDLVIDP